MNTFVVVTGVVVKGKEVLLLKRSQHNRIMPSKWECPSGFIKEYESCEEAILRELYEETSLNGQIESIGSPQIYFWYNSKWIVIPFLIDVFRGSIKLNRAEHHMYEWVFIENIDDYDLVVGTKEVLNKVLSG